MTGLYIRLHNHVNFGKNRNQSILRTAACRKMDLFRPSRNAALIFGLISLLPKAMIFAYNCFSNTGNRPRREKNKP